MLSFRFLYSFLQSMELLFRWSHDARSVRRAPMKMKRSGWRGACLAGLALSVAAACSTSEPLVVAETNPVSPNGGGPLPAQGQGEPYAVSDGTLNGEEVAAPVENPGPQATETNFLTLPCHVDSDCAGGGRCVFDSDEGARDAGASTDGSVDASDAAASDAAASGGGSLSTFGRCVRPGPG